MRFGIMHLCRIPFGQLAAQFEAAEAWGFDSAWVDDDIYTPAYADFDPWSVLGALAARTERIRIGTLVTVPTFRYPAVLAVQALTLDHISNGRIDLGLGAGGAAESYPAIGTEPWTPRERSERLEEYAAILATLLRGEPLTVDGARYRVNVETMIPPIQQPRPPLIVAAHGPRGLRTVARHADGWNSLLGIAGPGVDDPHAPRDLAEAVAQTRERRDRLAEICAQIGRDPTTIRRSLLVHRPQVEPLSSVDAFDEFTGRFGDIGIDEIIFYWPPLANLIPTAPGLPNGPLGRPADLPLDPALRRGFERVVAERIANR